MHFFFKKNYNIGENNNHADPVRKSVSLPSVRFIWSPFPNARIRAWGPCCHKSLQPSNRLSRKNEGFARQGRGEAETRSLQTTTSHRETWISKNNCRCLAPLTNPVLDGAADTDLMATQSSHCCVKKRAAQAAGQCRGWKWSRCRRGGGGQERPPALWLMKQRSTHLGSSIDPLPAFRAGSHCPQICKTCAPNCSHSELQLLSNVGRRKRWAAYWKLSRYNNDSSRVTVTLVLPCWIKAFKKNNINAGVAVLTFYSEFVKPKSSWRARSLLILRKQPIQNYYIKYCKFYLPAKSDTLFKLLKGAQTRNVHLSIRSILFFCEVTKALNELPCV